MREINLDEITYETRKKFIAKVEISGTDECWLWKAGFQSRGYGSFGCNGKTYLAHRVSYVIHKGIIPDGKIIMHLCDNKKCVNPNHLKVGTIAENNRAALPRRKSLTQELHVKSKLTTDDVRAIRKLRAENKFAYPILARKFNVSVNTIGRIVRKEYWNLPGAKLNTRDAC